MINFKITMLEIYLDIRIPKQFASFENINIPENKKLINLVSKR